MVNELKLAGNQHSRGMNPASILKNTAALAMSYNDSYNRIAASKRIKDYELLAFACKRAGKARDEGRAYYSAGVLFDNLGKYKKAV